MSLRSGWPWAAVVIAGVAAVVYAVFCYCVPLSVDDYMYVNRWNTSTGFSPFSFESYLKFIRANRAFDNFRICNMLVPMAVCFQPAMSIFPIFTGLMTGAILFLGYRLVNPQPQRLKQAFICALLWGEIIMFLPWFNLFIADYALNYIWSGAISLFAIFLALKIIDNRLSTGAFLLSLAVAFIAGGWHEGFSLPTLSGLALLAIMKKGKLPGRFYAFFLIYLLSAIFFLWSPGMWARMGRTMGGVTVGADYSAFAVVILLTAYILVLALSVRGRKILAEGVHNPFFVTGLGIIAAGYLIAILTDGSPRTFFWADLAATINLTILINASLESVKSRAFYATATAFLISLCLLQSAACIRMQLSIRREGNEILKMLRASERGMIFYDILIPKSLPWFYREMPVYDPWHSTWQYMLFLELLNTDFGGVVPEVLETVQIEKLTPLREEPEFYEVDGHIFSTNFVKSEWSQYNLGVDELRAPEQKELPYDVNETLKKGTAMGLYPFITQPYMHADGTNHPDTLIYYAPLIGN